MSRDHIAQLHCLDVARPEATASRICKRLSRDGYIITIPQPKDRPYLYKAKGTSIRENTSRLEHYLAIVDAYIDLGCPNVFEVEPAWPSYRPDAYAQVDGQYVCIEVQTSKVTNKRIQNKINRFVRSWQRQEHDATTLWIRSPYTWKHLQAPPQMQIKIAPTW